VFARDRKVGEVGMCQRKKQSDVKENQGRKRQCNRTSWMKVRVEFERSSVKCNKTVISIEINCSETAITTSGALQNQCAAKDRSGTVCAPRIVIILFENQYIFT
jgi:hypothetical protein